MTLNEGKNVANGVVSGVVVISGLMCCTLAGLYYDGRVLFILLFLPPALLCIMCGVTGLVATFSKIRGTYLLHMIFGMVTLVVSLVLFPLVYIYFPNLVIAIIMGITWTLTLVNTALVHSVYSSLRDNQEESARDIECHMPRNAAQLPAYHSSLHPETNMTGLPTNTKYHLVNSKRYSL